MKRDAKGRFAKVGFTGTLKGMSAGQKASFTKQLKTLQKKGAVEFHHGDALGADADAHEIAKSLGFKIVKHPPTDPKKRAYAKGGRTLPEKGYRERNTDIVNASDVMFAAPKESSRPGRHRSGTWMTVGLSEKAKKPVRILFPKPKKSGQDTAILGTHGRKQDRMETGAPRPSNVSSSSPELRSTSPFSSQRDRRRFGGLGSDLDRI